MHLKLSHAIALLLSSLSMLKGQINPGDIAIIQVNNTLDGFTWVALRDIAGVVTATDSSWGASSGEGWRTTENTERVLPGTIAAGTIGFISMGSGLSNGGDQVFLYNKTSSNFMSSTTATDAAFVFGINWDNSGWINAGTYSTSQSYLPATLAQHSLTLGSGDNWYYTGTTQGTSENLLSSILDAANWSISTNTNQQFGALRPEVTAFNIESAVAGNFPAVPEPSTIAAGLACLGFVALKKIRGGGKRQGVGAQSKLHSI